MTDSDDDRCDNGDCRTCWPRENRNLRRAVGCWLGPVKRDARLNSGQKLISTREQLAVSQTTAGWAGDVSAFPKKQTVKP
jgi:hypothetical protein